MFAVQDPIVWKKTVIMIMTTSFSPVQKELFTKPNVGQETAYYTKISSSFVEVFHLKFYMKQKT